MKAKAIVTQPFESRDNRAMPLSRRGRESRTEKRRDRSTPGAFDGGSVVKTDQPSGRPQERQSTREDPAQWGSVATPAPIDRHGDQRFACAD
jgi:hypothetical protein